MMPCKLEIRRNFCVTTLPELVRKASKVGRNVVSLLCIDARCSSFACSRHAPHLVAGDLIAENMHATLALVEHIAERSA